MKLSYNTTKDTILDVKYSKNDEVFSWGLDNLEPFLIESLINMSVTSKRCVNEVSKAIYGKSFGDLGKIIVNKKGQSLNEVLRIAAREYAKHNNVFIHVGYDANLDIKSIKVIPAKMVRIGKSDDLGYSGKFIIYNNWEAKEARVNKEDYQTYDRYNPNKEVITSQIENVGNIQKYRGQIIHLQQDSNEIYSLSDIYPVRSEALLEKNSQEFRCNGSEEGFLNTKLLTVKPFASEEERKGFKKTLKNLKGSKNSGGVLLLEASQMTEKLEDSIKLDDLSSQYNDQLFAYSDKQGRENICIAFGVPLSMISQSDGAMFGNSAESLVEMGRQLYRSREEERDMLEEIFSDLMKKFQNPIKEELKVISPFTTPSTPEL